MNLVLTDDESKILANWDILDKSESDALIQSISRLVDFYNRIPPSSTSDNHEKS